MLSRTADSLFWMSRYTERAENTARLLDVNTQMSLLPQTLEQAQMGWKSMLSISELEEQYDAVHQGYDARQVLHFMACDALNSASIISYRGVGDGEHHLVRGAETT
jgi:uncharacterized alpha-E superfamily protein